MPSETFRHPTGESGADTAGLLASALLLLLAALIGYDLTTLDLSATYGLGPQAMPGLVAVGLVLLAVANAVVAFKDGPQRRERVDLKAIFFILGGLGALILCLVAELGFISGITILFVATAAAFGRRAYLVDLTIGLALAVLTYLLFAKLLTLSLPTGPLERLL